MAGLFDIKQELAERQQNVQQNAPQPVQQPDVQFDPSAPTLSGRVRTNLAGGAVEGATRGIEQAKIEQLKAGVRGEFEKMLMKQERGVDEFVQSAINKYGPGIVEFLPPKELFYDSNGDFQPVEYYKHALVGIKEYRPIRGKEQEKEKVNAAMQEYLKLKGGKVSPEQQLAMATGGPEAGLEQAESEAVEAGKTERDEAGIESREGISEAGIESREKIARMNNASRERIAKAKRDLEDKEKLVDSVKLDDKARALRGETVRLKKMLDSITDKNSELYIETKELHNESNKAAKQYAKAAAQARLTEVQEKDKGKLLSEAGADVEAEEAQGIIEKFKSGGFRGFNILNPTTFGTGDDKKRFMEEFKQSTGVDVIEDEQGNLINPLTTPRQSQLQPSTDKRALAERALKDPNASEIVKAQARKILGR